MSRAVPGSGPSTEPGRRTARCAGCEEDVSMPKILQPTGGDVVEVILADHRWFEQALRELGDVSRIVADAEKDS
jgi:hypothetical protein